MKKYNLYVLLLGIVSLTLYWIPDVKRPELEEKTQLNHQNREVKDFTIIKIKKTGKVNSSKSFISKLSNNKYFMVLLNISLLLIQILTETNEII